MAEPQEETAPTGLRAQLEAAIAERDSWKAKAHDLLLGSVGVPKGARTLLSSYDGEYEPDAVKAWLVERDLGALIDKAPPEQPAAPVEDEDARLRRDAQTRLDALRAAGAPPTGGPPSLDDAIADAEARAKTGDRAAVDQVIALQAEKARAARPT